MLTINLDSIGSKTVISLLTLFIFAISSMFAYALYKDKTVVFMDMKFGISENEKYLSEIEEKHEKLLEEKDNEIKKQKLELKNNALTIEKLKVDLKNTMSELEESKNKKIIPYVRNKTILSGENFKDERTGIALSIQRVFKYGDSDWTFKVLLTIPESGTFERDLQPDDHWNFYVADKAYKLSISKIYYKDNKVDIAISEI